MGIKEGKGKGRTMCGFEGSVEMGRWRRRRNEDGDAEYREGRVCRRSRAVVLVESLIVKDLYI